MYPKAIAGPIVMPAPGYVPPITLAAYSLVQWHLSTLHRCPLVSVFLDDDQ